MSADNPSLPQKPLAPAQTGITFAPTENKNASTPVWSDYLKAMRPHQWLKNLLIFIPGLAGHVTSPDTYAVAALALLSFSLCASSVYILNDLVDLENDRAHTTKRLRPFASNTIPVRHGFILLSILLVMAFFLGWMVSPAFATVLLGYYLCTLAYSFAIKRMLALDVIMLACLYGIRVIAGGVACNVVLSEWLLAFSAFFFLSLALIKRAAELANRLCANESDPVGRAYRLNDLPVLESLAAAAGFVAMLVLALYISNPAVMDLYAFPKVLWGIDLVLAYWLCRMLILTHRGAMHDDPVAFAATDPISIVCSFFVGAIGIGASL